MAQGKKGSGQSGSGDQPASNLPKGKLSVGEWSARKRPTYRKFPGPRLAEAALRVAMEREPFAELTAHARESLDREVCGVVVGDACEDNEGPFLHIKAIIRGSAARQASTHVTYTQETWNQIHSTMENLYPKMQIVGWYHSHPGYGVEFSEMDAFIQKNFFSAPTQIGLVTDPLGGQMAVCINTEEGNQYLSQIWVDGRAQKCVAPSSAQQSAAPAAGATPADQRLEAVEQRLYQTLRALDDLRTTVFRFSLTLGMIVAVTVIGWIAYQIYSSYTREMRPPELLQYAPVPVQIGDKVALLGIAVMKWDIPAALQPKLQHDDKADGGQQQGAAPTPSAAASANQSRPAEPSSGAQPSGSPSPGQAAASPASNSPAAVNSSPAGPNNANASKTAGK
jgi:proteasome lid subunit RPN8/RPN11